MSESGKTTLAKRKLAPAYKRNGFGILVLDPLLDPEWDADFITDDPEAFLKVFWASRSCMAFMDEGAESVGRYNVAMQQTATRGRHWGHSCHYIVQGAVGLAPVIRDQCRHLFLFCTSQRNGKLLAEEWGKPELENCAQLKQFDYIHAVKFGGSNVGSSSDHRRADNDSRGSVGRNGHDPQGGAGEAGTEQNSDGSGSGEPEDSGGPA